MARPIELLQTIIGADRKRWLSLRSDRTAANVAYYGLSGTPAAAPEAAVWMIVRETADATNSSVFEVARQDSTDYTRLVWNNRASYFPDPPPVTSLPGDEFSLSGISKGRVRIISLTKDGWTPIPAVATPGRIAMRIQNLSGDEIALNYADYESLPAGYVGIALGNGNEASYAYTAQATVYGKLKTQSAGDILIEELMA